MPGQDFITIIKWWLTLFIVGASVAPLAWLIFRKFVDVGYGFTKTIGILSISYFIFVGGTLKLIPFTRPVLVAILLAVAVINTYIFKKYKGAIVKAYLEKKKIIVLQEIIFFIGLAGWSYVRAHQPDILGLEKFMDFGFINTILNSKFLPPKDMWFAGHTINYYWFGHLWAAVTTKLSGIPSATTYNLLLGTILGIGLSGALSLVASLFKSLKLGTNLKAAIVAGLLSAVLFNLAGNFHAPYFILKEGSDKYWYPDATRLIGHNPETEDKTIHEFPLYSYVVSDLHAHVLDMPFVVLFLAVLVSKRVFKSKKRKNFKEEVFFLAPLGVLLGIMFSTSSWEFAVYFMVAGITLGLFNLVRYKFGTELIWETIKSLGTILAIAFVIALPFLTNFESLAKGINTVTMRSPAWQLAILWGFPAIFTIIFTVFLYFKRKEVKKADIFILALLISSWILIAIPEFIYVKDIYIASYSRANTMFKLVFQAFIMFYISIGYIAIRVATTLKKDADRGLVSLSFAILFASVLIYPYFAVKSYYGNLQNYKGLSGETWVEQRHPDEYQAILWLRENTKNQPVIVEAVGDSYTEFNIISSYTGLPTIEGWLVHEWLWRGSFDEPGKRGGEVDLIYNTDDVSAAKNLLDQYKVEYIIVGNLEKQKYPNLYEQKFELLGDRVASFGNLNIYKRTI